MFSIENFGKLSFEFEIFSLKLAKNDPSEPQIFEQSRLFFYILRLRLSVEGCKTVFGIETFSHWIFVWNVDIVISNWENSVYFKIGKLSTQYFAPGEVFLYKNVLFGNEILQISRKIYNFSNGNLQEMFNKIKHGPFR